jgi:hypothetical protein
MQRKQASNVQEIKQLKKNDCLVMESCKVPKQILSNIFSWPNKVSACERQKASVPEGRFSSKNSSKSQASSQNSARSIVSDHLNYLRASSEINLIKEEINSQNSGQ